jgi:nucleoside-diphosphate-sugar epimerase
MEGIDVVIHLAARAHVMDDDSSNPLAEYRRINVDGTKVVAEAASDASVKRLIFLSSIKVNGEQTFGSPYTASDIPAPEDAYGISKAEAEKILTEISTRTGLETVIIRTPLVYGPGVRANFLSLMSLANGGLPLPFGAITKNRRSLIYIGNLIDILVTATKHPAASGQTFLVRDGTDLSTARLVGLLRSTLGKPARMISVPPAALHGLLSLLGKKHMSSRLLGSLAIDDYTTQNILGWSPAFSVEDGLKRTVDWYRAMKDKN